MRSLVVRMMALAALASAFALLVGGFSASQLLQQSAREHERSMLVANADLIAGLISNSPDVRYNVVPTSARYLLETFDQRDNSYSIVAANGLIATGLAAPQVDARVAKQLAAGATLSFASTHDGEMYLVEGRPLPEGRGLLLFQRVRTDERLAAAMEQSILWALLLGVVVATTIGIVGARWISAPLTRAVDGARAMAAGRRDVRVPTEGPTEVAAVSHALNELSDTLRSEEGRQREFLLSVSHELRTPLTGIRGYAEALADGVLDANGVSDAGAVMRDEALHMERLITDLIELARYRERRISLEVSETDLCETATATARAWQSRAAKSSIKIVVEMPERPIVVPTDPVRVRQFVDIAVDNAVRVCPPGSTIVLQVGEVPARISVSDNGPGLTEDDLAVAFERSALHDRYRGERRVGSGVGLALAGSIADTLGGRALAAHSDEGGARFTLELPDTAPGEAVGDVDLRRRGSTGR